MEIIGNGCMIDGIEYGIAALESCVSEFITMDFSIWIYRNCELKEITYEQFDDLFYEVSNFFNAALKEDCIFYRFTDDNKVVVRNRDGEERTISLDLFDRVYRF